MEGALRRPLPPDLRLIETFGWRPGPRDGGFVRLPAHLARLAATAARLGVPFRRSAVDAALDGVSAVAREGPQRVRLTVAPDGSIAVTAVPLGAGPAVWQVALAAERLDAEDPWLRVKTSERGRYDAARAALPAGTDEVLFLNTRGEVCEGTITNVFVEADGVLLTPPLASGLLPGVLRAELLATGAAREAVLGVADLRGRLFVGNSLRGLCPARFGE